MKTPNSPNSVGTYNQAIESNNLIFTSGQVGIDPVTNTLVKGGLKNELNQVLNNLDTILKDSKLNRNHIVKLIVFLIDINQFNIVNSVFKNSLIVLSFQQDLQLRSLNCLWELALKLNVLHLDKIKLFFKILITITSLNFIQANNEITSTNKSPKKAFYYSLIPGLGQVYNDKLIKSALVIGLELSAYHAWRSNLENTIHMMKTIIH